MTRRTEDRADDLDSGTVRQPRRFDRVAIRRLRAQGKSYRQIAVEVGCSVGLVQQAVAEGDGNDWVADLLQPTVELPGDCGGTVPQPMSRSGWGHAEGPPVEYDLDVGEPSEDWGALPVVRKPSDVAIAVPSIEIEW